MKKRLNRLWMGLNLKYDIKREYFTLALPLLLSVMYVIASLYQVGYIGPQQQKKADTAGPSLSDFKEGQDITEEQLLQIAEAKKAAAKPTRDKTADSITGIAVFAVLIAITPYSIDLMLKRRRIRRYEEDYSDFLFQMSEMMRGGIDPVKSTIELSQTDLGSITRYVRRATARMSYGKSFEYSMRAMAKSLESKLVDRYTDLLIHASYTGGNVSEQIMRSSEDMKKFIGLEREKESSLRMYVLIMYMAQGLLLMIAGDFVFNILPALQNVNVGMFIQGATGPQLSKPTIIFYVTHIIMINAFFVGLIAGKVSTGSIKNGLKHSAGLLMGSYLITIFLITPQITGIDALKITAVSYPATVSMGGALPEPVVFKVTDAKDKPVENASIAFSITGPAPGKIMNPDLKTDKDGKISTHVSLGVMPGVYTVQASYNENTGTADIKLAETQGA